MGSWLCHGQSHISKKHFFTSPWRLGVCLLFNYVNVLKTQSNWRCLHSLNKTRNKIFLTHLNFNTIIGTNCCDKKNLPQKCAKKENIFSFTGEQFMKTCQLVLFVIVLETFKNGGVQFFLLIHISTWFRKCFCSLQLTLLHKLQAAVFYFIWKQNIYLLLSKISAFLQHAILSQQNQYILQFRSVTEKYQ